MSDDTEPRIDTRTDADKVSLRRYLRIVHSSLGLPGTPPPIFEDVPSPPPMERGYPEPWPASRVSWPPPTEDRQFSEPETISGDLTSPTPAPGHDYLRRQIRDKEHRRSPTHDDRNPETRKADEKYQCTIRVLARNRAIRLKNAEKTMWDLEAPLTPLLDINTEAPIVGFPETLRDIDKLSYEDGIRILAALGGSHDGGDEWAVLYRVRRWAATNPCGFEELGVRPAKRKRRNGDVAGCNHQ